MNITEYNGTQAYRDHLVKSLEVAKVHLSKRDFEKLAIGITQEIERVNNEMAEYPLHLLFSCANRGWGTWAAITITQTGSMTAHKPSPILFNSPAKATPWTTRKLYRDDRRLGESAMAIGAVPA
jgi:hypothetical protein